MNLIIIRATDLKHAPKGQTIKSTTVFSFTTKTCRVQLEVYITSSHIAHHAPLANISSIDGFSLPILTELWKINY